MCHVSVSVYNQRVTSQEPGTCLDMLITTHTPRKDLFVLLLVSDFMMGMKWQDAIIILFAVIVLMGFDECVKH